VVVLAVLVAGGGWFFFFRGGRNFDRVGGTVLDFDRVGGTTLFYEVDESAEGGGDRAALVEAVQRRLKDTGLGHVKARAAEGGVEVLVPRSRPVDTGQGHHSDVQRVKEVLAWRGDLVFRIVANSRDDKEAIDAAAAWINSAGTDPAAQAELVKAQARGEPPPGPRQGNRPRVFSIRLGDDAGIRVTYDWVQVGLPEVNQHKLRRAEASAGDGGLSPADKLLAERRNQAVADVPAVHGMPILGGALFYSRARATEGLSAEEKARKPVEYFLLARGPDISPEAETQGLPTGKDLVKVEKDTARDTLAISFQFGPAGGARMLRLTRQNKPDGGFHRNLAIVLDGKVVSAPTLNEPIRERGQITGSFSEQEVTDLVHILRSGALPPALRTVPKSETVVGPRGRR
jgi:SecD/SecF fusion protein